MNLIPITAPSGHRQYYAKILYLHRVSAGFPSPADDYVENRLSLDELVIEHQEATYFVRVEGDSMEDAGIFSGDILVVDTTAEPRSGSVVVVALDGELTVKQLELQAATPERPGRLLLAPRNGAYRPLEVLEGQAFEIWGVVTYVLHPMPSR